MLRSPLVAVAIVLFVGFLLGTNFPYAKLRFT